MAATAASSSGSSTMASSSLDDAAERKMGMMMKVKEKPHAVVIPFPLQGHINPVMQLSKLLAMEYGFRVTLLCTEHVVNRMLQAQQPYIQREDIDQGQGGHHYLGLDIRLMGVPDGLPPAHPRDANTPDFPFILLPSFQQAVQTLAFPKLMADHRAADTCTNPVLIADSFLVWTQSMADTWHVPRVAFWTNSLAAFALSFHLPQLMETLDPFKTEVYTGDASCSPLCNVIPNIPDIPFCALPFKTLFGEDSARWLQSHVEEQFECLERALCVVVNTSEGLEGEVWDHMKGQKVSLYALGPLIPSAYLTGSNDKESGNVGDNINNGSDNSADRNGKDGDNISNGGDKISKDVAMATSAEGYSVGANLMCDEADECLRWLEEQADGSVLYIAMGSITSLTEEEIREIRAALAASGQPFLWAAGADGEAASLAAEAAEGKDGLRGKVVKWAPQLRVLEHRAVGGFLSHCGWNSTLESAALGVPVLAWPRMLDQLTNCWFLVERWRVGLRLPAVDRIAVEAGIHAMMQDPLLRSRASQLRLAIASSFASSRPRQLHALAHRILTHLPVSHNPI